MITTENNQFDVRFLFQLNFSQYFTFSFHSGTWLTTVSPSIIYDNYLATSDFFEEYNSLQIPTYSVDSGHEN
jgi:hypothetical protein